MAALSSTKTYAFEKLLDASLTALDAELAAYGLAHRQNRWWVSRVEMVPGNLVYYRVSSEDGWHLYGECGYIVLQYHDSQKTILGYQVFVPTDDDLFVYMKACLFPVPDDKTALKTDPVLLHDWRTKLQENRKKFLQQICDTVTDNINSRVRPEHTDDSGALKLGRPYLPEDSRIIRIALFLLENMLKKKDPGLRRMEFVALATDKLNIPVESNMVKNARSLYDKAKKQGDLKLLTQAEARASKWLERFE